MFQRSLSNPNRTKNYINPLKVKLMPFKSNGYIDEKNMGHTAVSVNKARSVTSRQKEPVRKYSMYYEYIEGAVDPNWKQNI